MLSTNDKGAIAEAAIVLAAVKLGVGVYKPVGEGGRADPILELGRRLLRVQCKWAPRHGDVIAIRWYSSRRVDGGFRKRSYTPEEIDAIAAYCPELERCYLLPIEEFGARTAVQLRLGPTLNNQSRLVNWAEDYEFGATLRSTGAIAQLGERLHGMQEVTGSNPVGSISGTTSPSGITRPRVA
jgi:PD-(D/E)XK endonuclease